MPKQDIDALSDDFFNARKEELQTRVNKHRFKHCLGVMEACMMLAKTYDIDVKKARLAGLLHDWDKGYDDDGIRARALEVGLKEDPQVLDMVPQALHGQTAALALQRDYPEIPADVIQAISRHTICAIDMDPLDELLYIADAIEKNRKVEKIGEGLNDLRKMVGTVSLEDLFFETYRFWTILLINRTSSMHPDTITVWNEYVCRRKPCGKKKF